MRTGRILAVAGLIALTAMSAGAARRPSEPAPSPLYVLEKASPPKSGRPLLPNAAEEFLIQVDPADVAANPPSFLIDLPGHALLEAVRTSFVSYRADWKSWFGTLRYASGGDPAGSIHVGYHGAQISALIQLDEGDTYRIVGGFGESHRLVRLDAANTPLSCGLGMEAATGGLEEEIPLLSGKPPARRAPAASAKILSCAANAEIDVLVVYPSRGTAGLPGFFELSDFSEHILRDIFVPTAISYANQVFVNSGLPNVHYRLVGVVPLINQDNLNAQGQPNDPSLPTSGLRDVLTWMTQQYAELANLRNAFGADVVAVYTPMNWEGTANTPDRACGLGNLPRNNSTFESGGGTVNQPMGQRAFTALRYSCGQDDLTLAHEIGHNYGMCHHDDFAANRLFPWALGYNFTDTSQNPSVPRATVMGCNCNPGGPCDGGNYAVCNRIPYFSDPDKTYHGLAIGTAALNHNARVACDQVPLYSAFRTASGNPQPNPSFTVSCTGLTCTFNASGTTDNQAIPANNYWWDFGDNGGIVNGTSVITHPYNAAGSYRVHLVVKDNGLPSNDSSPQGKTQVTWSDVTVQAAPRDARIVYENVPTSMTAGQVYPVNVKVKNVGTLTWSPIGPQCNAYRLGSANPYNNGTWVPATRVELPAPVAPGEQVTLSFNVTAPSTPGTYNFQWQMVQECVTWFGDSPNVAVTVQAPRDAEFLSQSVPTTMTAGQVYPVSMTVKNVGALTWSPIGPQCNAYRLGSPSPNDNTWSPTRADLPAAVPPGGQVTLNFNVTAPATPGTYNFQWRMLQECVTWFGPLSPNVVVNVQGAPPIYQGYHDIGNCRDIYGWARDANSPSPINVNIYRDGSYDATVTANLYRADLYNAGIGTGYYGFDYVPSSSLWRDGQWHSATVRFPSGANLNTTPKSIICNVSMFPSLTPQENNPTNGVVYTAGTQFSSSVSGRVTHLGFWRAPGETGTNTLRLWTDDGSLLASATTSCTSSGWCWISIYPINITAGTRYRVSVNTNTYQVKTGCGLGGGLTNQVLTAHSGYWIDGNTFPIYGSCSNFFVDVKFDL